MGRQFLLYKEQLGGVYAVTYVGSPLYMVQERVLSDFGVFSPRGVCVLNNVHYIVG